MAPETTSWRRRLAVGAAVVVALLVGGGVVVVQRADRAPAARVEADSGDADHREVTIPPAVPAPEETDEPGEIPAVERPAHPEGFPVVAVPPPSSPVGVDIPAIGVSSGLDRLGLDADGAMEVPATGDVAGWFSLGAEPGQLGPAVIAGHVAWRGMRGVFSRLDELAVGDEVLVHREDGSTVRFTVDGVQHHPKDSFPTEAVYGPVPGAELRLITCGGVYDSSTGHYRDNTVVYAVAS